ncbi:Immunoglobulin V-set domain [Desmophyllum pertusum]|uniref:Immunoglobulin V-set domain n=1 Tax=Desmophyllum pertusum TaxID=174260 RepID=A0A9X0D3H2_9CNID|nr:Immunoglobulin V-set domain [Desmophyllum pertusum]
MYSVVNSVRMPTDYCILLAVLLLPYADKPEGTKINTCAAQNTVTQGDSVTLACHVTAANPQVSQYSFYLNDSLVKAASDNQYTINNVQRSQHYGKYKCIPHNDVGDGPEASVTLHVNGE